MLWGERSGDGEEGEDGKGTERPGIVHTCTLLATMKTMERTTATTVTVKMQSRGRSIQGEPRRCWGRHHQSARHSQRLALPLSFASSSTTTATTHAL